MVNHKICLLIALVWLSFTDISNAQNPKKKRTLRKIPSKESALKYLTQDMSEMEYFKSDILTPIMKERVSGTQGNKEVQEFIKEKMRSFGWQIEEDSFNQTTPYGEKDFNNIIATFDPSKTQKIVVACHFDSKYYKYKKPGDLRFLGATDSAVPCAIMIESARQLSCLLLKGPKDRSPVKDVTLQFVFLDGEEAFKEWTETDSIYGSRHLAERWNNELASPSSTETKLERIREFILLDLIGTSDTKIREQFSDTKEVYKNLVESEKTLKNKGYLVRNKPNPIFTNSQRLGLIEDDHKPFEAKGVPIVHLISTPFPSVWHKKTDNWENLDFDLIDDFSRIFRVFLSNLLHLQPEDQGCRKKIHQEL